MSNKLKIGQEIYLIHNKHYGLDKLITFRIISFDNETICVQKHKSQDRWGKIEFINRETPMFFDYTQAQMALKKNRSY